ncbi:MAG: GntR family transcriptional regulator [Paracoccaceae bacterium]
MDGAAGGEPRRGSAAETAYAALRADILAGALAPGDRLTETALAGRLGLSRTPIREALNRLAIEGFVDRAPGLAARVAAFRVDEVEQVFRIRVLLEGYAARRAAERASPAQVAELARLAAAMSARTPPRSAEDFEALSADNERFHRLVMEAAEAHRLAAILALTVQVALVQRTYRRFSERDLIRSARHHEELAEAVAARAPDWAESVMAAHLLAAAAAVRRAGEGAGAEAARRAG